MLSSLAPFERKNVETSAEYAPYEDPLTFAGKTVLVTGSGGYIGSAVSRKIAASSPARLLLLDSSEQALYEVSRTLEGIPHSAGTTPILGSVCDSGLLDWLFEQYAPEMVIHLAAFKHVPLLESNPFAAIANNVFGTDTLLQAAVSHGCAQLAMVSTDKAADPISIMGASKRIAELLLLTNTGGSRLAVVRLVNVLGAPGSVVPLFLDQMDRGAPISVTHADARRYFMTLSEAVTAVVSALSLGAQGLYAVQTGEALRIVNLAEQLFAERRAAANRRPEIVFAGLRPGDKLDEVLISSEESWATSGASPSRSPLLRAISGNVPKAEEVALSLEKLRDAVERRQLSALLDAVKSLVPKYRPSETVLAALSQAQSAGVKG